MKRAQCKAPGCNITRRPEGGWWKANKDDWYCSHIHRAIYDTTIGSAQKAMRQKGSK